MNSEDDEEEPQCSQLHHTLNEEVRDSVGDQYQDRNPDQLPADYKTSSDHEISELGCHDLKSLSAAQSVGRFLHIRPSWRPICDVTQERDHSDAQL